MCSLGFFWTLKSFGNTSFTITFLCELLLKDKPENYNSVISLWSSWVVCASWKCCLFICPGEGVKFIATFGREADGNSTLFYVIFMALRYFVTIRCSASVIPQGCNIVFIVNIYLVSGGSLFFHPWWISLCLPHYI